MSSSTMPTLAPHIEIIIKSCKWIDIEVSTGIEKDFYNSNDDLDTDVGCNSECGTVFIEQLSNGNGQVDAEGFQKWYLVGRIQQDESWGKMFWKMTEESEIWTASEFVGQ